MGSTVIKSMDSRLESESSNPESTSYQLLLNPLCLGWTICEKEKIVPAW